ncbi:ASCH domain-containing protein [Liquorilactobacillus capillatus]|uniref:ASCH domain-containing protein n=1 Tax=Liquorilactobacillus capillatus DSM 19910 TaxID=1423731 RepID=A0A0R1LZH1_9LACO|nr:ASCH domain-containing protein [Liquorilactobacillus capillatus]KRL00942.1 hypothetical protein FC81_GL001777 [Liquorilactobacillus capillatus DSM 19910]
MEKSQKIQQYWERFKTERDIQDDYYLAEQFGYGKETGDELAELIIAGIKTATSSALELYEDDEPKPKVGAYTILLDGSGLPACVIRTEKVEIVNFDKVSAAHAKREGEGDRSLKYWREGHKDFFEKEYQLTGKKFTTNIPCICETFTVVYI